MRLIDVDRLLDAVTTTSEHAGWSCTSESEAELIDLINEQPIYAEVPKSMVERSLIVLFEKAAKEIEHRLIYGEEDEE